MRCLFYSHCEIRVAEKLDQFGIDYIEGGWPGSNPRDMAFFEQANDLNLKHSKIAAFGPLDEQISPSKKTSGKALARSKHPCGYHLWQTWLLHVTDVLRTTPEENLAMIEDTSGI